MFVDSHCHLDHLAWNQEELKPFLKRAQHAGIHHMLSIGTTEEDFSRILTLALPHSTVWVTVGLHPAEGVEKTQKSPKEIHTWLLKHCAHPKVVGIGETGLDLMDTSPPLDRQIAYLWAHMEAALETGLPLVIHTRQADNAFRDVLERFLKTHKILPKGVLHCFTGGYDLAEYVMVHGWKISFSGILTFPNAKTVQEVASQIPLEALLLETDAPWLAPLPHRGRPNEPAYLVHTAQKLADLKSVSLEEVAKHTTASFFSLFTKATRGNPI